MWIYTNPNIILWLVATPWGIGGAWNTAPTLSSTRHNNNVRYSTTRASPSWLVYSTAAAGAAADTTAASPSSSSSSSPVITLDGKEIRGPISLLQGALLVKVKDTFTATSGGILLPDQSKQRRTEGLVLEAGPGKLHPFTAVRITNPIQPGMSVLYGKFDGTMVEYKGEDCQLIRDDDVLLAYTGLTMKLDNVEPVRDYVLIDTQGSSNSDQPAMTKSGVVLAAQVMKDDLPCEGRVVKVGVGRMASNGALTASPVKPGDYVKFRDYAGNDVIIEGKQYSVVKMVDILCTRME